MESEGMGICFVSQVFGHKEPCLPQTWSWDWPSPSLESALFTLEHAPFLGLHD